MTTRFEIKRHTRKKGNSFNPSHDDIQNALKSFKKKGGKITKIKSIPKEQEEVIHRYNSGRYSNSFNADR